MAVDYNGIFDDGLKATKLTYNGLYSLSGDLGIPPFVGGVIAFGLAGIVLIGRLLYAIVILTFVSVGTSLITAVLQVIKQIRQDGAADFAEVTGEALGEFMAIDTKDVSFATGKDPAAALQRAKQLGDVFISMMQEQFGKGGPQSPDAGEAAAKALAGYGINFATSNVFLSWLVELGTDGKLGDFDKLGEDIASTVGLGRLTRRALQPLVRNAISHPYDRKMRAQYRPDLLAPAELVKAALSGRMSEAAARDYIAQHGFSDEFITELFAQHRVFLHASDLELLSALGVVTASDASATLQEQGITQGIAELQLKALTWKRLHPLRQAILSEVFSQIQHGFQPAAAMDDAVSKVGIPQDEADLWRQRVGNLESVPRKRLSVGEMLFLFENSQVTLNEVQQWAEAEGFSQSDQLSLQLYFELKATAAHRTASGTATAAAQHVHDEHTAWVTDEFTGVFGNPPTTAQLAHWVTLLDNRQRTKADVKTEMKAGQKGA